MKKILILVSTSFLLLQGFAFALQVSPEEIEVSPEGIFAFIDNDWIEVDALYRTPLGQYEIELKADETSRVRTTWACPHCGHVNGFHRRTCERCGKHPMQN